MLTATQRKVLLLLKNENWRNAAWLGAKLNTLNALALKKYIESRCEQKEDIDPRFDIEWRITVAGFTILEVSGKL